MATDTLIEQETRVLAQRKGYVMRRALDGQDRWHLMTPGIDGALYGLSMANPHSFTLDEARLFLASKPDSGGA
ncbi:MAG: hypothetical protein R3D68_00665 [Hyphomicrobiaceae bacterium]